MCLRWDSSSGNTGTILHYDGSTWSYFPYSEIGPMTRYGVWGSSGSDVFAVGYLALFSITTGATGLPWEA